MFKFYMCPDEKCIWDKNAGKKGEFCPECGKELKEVGFRESVSLGSKKQLLPEYKERKKLEKEASKKEPENTGEKLSGYGEETFILSDNGIRVEKKGVLSCRDKGFEEIQYSDITNISIDKGFVSATVEIKYRGGEYKIPNIIPEAGEKFVNNVRERIKNSDTPKTTLSPMDEIKKAKELLDIGAITQEEFEKVKQKYL